MTTRDALVVTSEARRPFFSPRGLADYLALSPRTVRDMLARGVIPSYKFEGSRRVDPAAADRHAGAVPDAAGEALARVAVLP
jgi:excisionase family DNA binding protein